MGRSVPVTWEGRTVDAADPDPIAEWDPPLSASTVRRTEQAAAAVQRAGDLATGPLEVATRLLLRAEGLASSAIEGVRATAADVALAVAAEHAGTVPVAAGTAAWVADNLAVVSDALVDRRPLRPRILLAWHVRLMRHSPALEERHLGAWRDRLGWVGGPNPRLAAHVAVPHERIPALIDDLIAFVGRTDVDPVTQAAVAHAQFETIHPFADGNGRIGRVLIGRILAHRLDVAVPPPVSLELAGDVGGYQGGLTLFRQGHHEQWVAWFAGAVEVAAHRSRDVLAAVATVQQAWREATADLRRDSTARRLVEILPAHPALSAATVSDVVGVTPQAALGALTALTDRGVLIEVHAPPSARGRPRRWFVAAQLLDLLGR